MWLAQILGPIRALQVARALACLGRADRIDLARWRVLGGLLDPRQAALLDPHPLPDLPWLLEAVMNFP